MDVAVVKKEKASVFNRETVTEVRHWTDKLFSFRTTRDPGFRFENGQFVMIGLEVDGRPLLRAYSIASANHQDHLEFFSIKVPNGPLTSRLASIREGDQVLVGKKPTGTLLLDNLLAGKRLYLLSTGTGLAPFAGLIQDPEAYERFDQIVLVHGCREVAELAYGQELVARLKADEFFGDYAREKLIHYATATRESFEHQGRITDLIASGKLAADLGLPPLDPAEDRIMLCGSEGLLRELQAKFKADGFAEGNTGEPGHFVIEKAFVER